MELFEKNNENNNADIERRKTVVTSRPRQINVALTTRCNIDCRMCKVKTMNWELPRKAIEDVVAHFSYIEKVLWQGGEVFLYPGFKEILKESSKYPHLSHQITTNGHFLNESWIEAINATKVDLNISIDSTDKDVYEYIRKGSRFENVLRNIELLDAMHHARRRHLIVTVMKSNYNQLDGFVDFAARYGFSLILFQRARTDSGDANDEFVFNNTDAAVLDRVVNQMREVKEKAAAAGIYIINGVAPRVDSPDAVDDGDRSSAAGTGCEKLFCLAPWQQLFIGWGGYVYPNCLCMKDENSEKIAVGDIRSESIDEIWNGMKMVQFREKLVERCYHGFCNSECTEGAFPERLRNLPPERIL